MTQNGDPLENATAERVNGILKDEYLYNYPCNTMKEAKQYLETAIVLYKQSVRIAVLVILHPNMCIIIIMLFLKIK